MPTPGCAESRELSPCPPQLNTLCRWRPLEAFSLRLTCLASEAVTGQAVSTSFSEVAILQKASAAFHYYNYCFQGTGCSEMATLPHLNNMCVCVFCFKLAMGEANTEHLSAAGSTIPLMSEPELQSMNSSNLPHDRVCSSWPSPTPPPSDQGKKAPARAGFERTPPKQQKQHHQGKP